MLITNLNFRQASRSASATCYPAGDKLSSFSSIFRPFPEYSKFNANRDSNNLTLAPDHPDPSGCHRQSNQTPKLFTPPPDIPRYLNDYSPPSMTTFPRTTFSRAHRLYAFGIDRSEFLHRLMHKTYNKSLDKSYGYNL
jgi:hypothetical protein